MRVRQAAEKRQLRVDNQRLREQLARQSALPEIVSVSDAMKEAVRLVSRVAPSDTSVLITGESGTGKELIAQAIHRLSTRAQGSFIDLNCAAFQESLLESELFGYEAGAFSGAKARKLGLVELADGGSLFLDEVTELPAQLQAKLLRAIETRTFFRVGGVRKVEVNVRIIAATNRNLDSVVADGSFRSDLLYRINGFQIDLKSLRERPEDIEPLARHLLKLVGGTNPPEIVPEALSALRAYHWPGNVRQLRNCLERAVILANNGQITVSELPPEVVRAPFLAPPPRFPRSLVHKWKACRGRFRPFVVAGSRTPADIVGAGTDGLASRQDRGAVGHFTLYALPAPARLQPRASRLVFKEPRAKRQRAKFVALRLSALLFPLSSIQIGASGEQSTRADLFCDIRGLSFRF